MCKFASLDADYHALCPHVTHTVFALFSTRIMQCLVPRSCVHRDSAMQAQQAGAACAHARSAAQPELEVRSLSSTQQLRAQAKLIPQHEHKDEKQPHGGGGCSARVHVVGRKRIKQHKRSGSASNNNTPATQHYTR